MVDDWVIVSERGISNRQQFLGFVSSRQLTLSSFEMKGDARLMVYGDAAVLTCHVTDTAHFCG